MEVRFMLRPVPLSDDLTHLIAQICTLILAVLIWWVVTAPSAV